MRKNFELIISDAIIEYPTRIKKMEDKIVDFDKDLENMMLYNSGDDLSNLIKKRLSEKISLMSEEIKKTSDWIQTYIDDLDVLCKGFITNKYSTISEYNEAKNIINDDFR